MSEIHNSDIRELLDAIPVIPNELMAEYLTRQYQVSKTWHRKSFTTPAVKAPTAVRLAILPKKGWRKPITSR